MSDRTKWLILLGVLISLVAIALKSPPQLTVNGPQLPDSVDVRVPVVLQLGPNRIAVVETNRLSGLFGTMLVFDFDEEKRTFTLAGSGNYADYFRNPQKYGLATLD